MRGISRHAALMGNCPTCSHMSWSYQPIKWFAISPLHVVRGTWDSVATSNTPLEKKVDMKCMRVNVLKNIARVTRRLCVRILEWVYTLFRVNLHSVVVWMCEGAPCSKQTQYLTLKWLQRDSNRQPLSQQFSQTSHMVKCLNFAKWLSVLYKCL